MSGSIYRDYDQAALDDQYTARPRIPNYDSYLERWPQESAAARANLQLVADVSYGAHELESLDVFPAGDNAPLHLFFHGGYWFSQDKHVFSFMAPSFVAAGACLMSANYPLCPAVRMTDLVAHCRAATAHAWRHARDWGADPDRLFVAGHSAGGHIATMLLATDWPSLAPDLPPDMIKGAVAISGLYDLEPVRLCYANANLHLDAAEAEAVSPVRLGPPRAGALALAVGGNESEEFHRQQADLAKAWHGDGLACETRTLPGLNHFSIMDDYAQPDGALLRLACAQMGL